MSRNYITLLPLPFEDQHTFHPDWHQSGSVQQPVGFSPVHPVCSYQYCLIQLQREKVSELRMLLMYSTKRWNVNLTGDEILMTPRSPMFTDYGPSYTHQKLESWPLPPTTTKKCWCVLTRNKPKWNTNPHPINNKDFSISLYDMQTNGTARDRERYREWDRN